MARISATTRFVKSSGWDWIVYYLDEDDPEVLSMSVFGQMKPEDALSEARFSLGTSDSDYQIIGLSRADKELPR